ncbi:MAG: N-acetyltransferase [Alphaproteobacteria bacterium]
MLKQPFLVALEAPHQSPLVEALNDRAFGPGRFVKTSYRLREGREGLPELSFVARDGDVLCGSVRYWPVTIGKAPALLLGPLAVHPERQNQGIGKALMELSLERAAELGHRLVILVGDPPYYARVGFAPVPVGQMSLPGPVDPARILYKELVPGALAGARGEVKPAGRRIA